MAITINIKCTNGEKFSIPQVDLSSTVETFKTLVSETTSVPPGQQRLIYKGHVLKDEKTLQSYDLQENHTIILVKGTRTANSAPSPQPQPQPQATPNPFQPHPQPQQPNPFNMGMGGDSLNLAAMQQQLLQDPEQLSRMMNSPIMQSLLDNPELMQGMMMNNPQIRALMESNPELAHVMNDPNTMRQCLEMARNPELMREATRNTDRQMSNIEAHPEGFNALRRMYQDIQAPMNDAVTPSQDSSNTVISQDSSTTPADAPLPNPWASRAPPSNTPPVPPVNQFGAMGGNPFAGGMPQNPEALLQMMDNPMMQQMMQQMFSNPDTLESMLTSNPMTRNMMESNPAMRDMLRNPQFLQSMSNPDTLRAMLQLQGAMGNMQGAMGNMGTQPAANPFPMFGAPQGQANPYASLFPQAAASGQPSAANPFAAIPQQPPARPEILYREQLNSLNSMGFTNAEANLNALVQTGGNIEAAIDRLLQG